MGDYVKIYGPDGIEVNVPKEEVGQNPLDMITKYHTEPLKKLSKPYQTSPI